MSTIPKTWQKKPHYEAVMAWFTREPRERYVMGQKFMTEESKEFPGWYFFLRADEHRVYDRLEEAVGKIKTTLKNWRMQDRFGLDRVTFQASKEERKQMVVQLLEYPIVNPTPSTQPDDDGNEIVQLKWEFSEYMLVASIWHTPFGEEFTTTMGNPDNPIKSLVGKVCTLQAATQADLDRELDDEDFEAEWKEIAVGPVSFEDNRLTIGFWSHTFDPTTPVVGVAYEEASFEDEKMSYYVNTKVKE